MFNGPDAKLILKQLGSETNNLQVNDTIRELMRQACLVNLFFYLKYVAGTSGPYNEITKTLHLDMCNFRQSETCMGDGARWAAFLPRGHFKSTIFTHGAAGWEVLRNPDIRIRIVNNIKDKAFTFVDAVRDTFKNNEVFKWLFPEYVLPPSQAAVTVPCRSRNFPEPSIQAGGVGGASEGDHHDMLLLDDIHGLNDLDAFKSAGADMEKKRAWAKTSTRALLMNWRTSRIGIIGTRYSIDDYYQDVINDCKKFHGFRSDRFEDKPDGKWSVYYRKCIENEEVIFPENFTKDEYEKLQIDDIWTFQTQYMNDPYESGIVEFGNLKVKKAYLGDKCVEFPQEDDADGYTVYWEDLHIVGAIDPAFTEKGITSKTSRTSMQIWGGDWKKRYVLLWSKTGYFDPRDAIDIYCKGLKKFYGYITRTIVESNAQQKLFASLLKDKQYEKGLYVYVDPKPVGTEKLARIRTGLGTPLMRGQVYACEGMGIDLREEVSMFPQSKKMDTLDCAEKGITAITFPDTPSREYEEEEEMEFTYADKSDVTGY